MDKFSFSNQLVERDNILTNLFDLYVSNLKENYNNLKEVDKNVFEDGLKNCVIKLAHVDNSNESQKQVVTQILNEKFDDINSLDKRYEELLNEKEKTMGNEHEMIIKFNQQVEELKNSETEKEMEDYQDQDSELVLMQDNMNILCPISKKKMTNPYTNRKCGHIYEYTNIMHLLAHNKKLKCPVGGCIVQQHIKPKDLEQNVELKQKLNNNTD